MTSRAQFLEWLLSERVPSFCQGRDDIRPDSLDQRNLAKVSEFDARWFMGALDAGYVAQSDRPSKRLTTEVKLDIFHHGLSGPASRKFFLALEPIITIGAMARLIDQFGWPAEQIIKSVFPYPFDLLCVNREKTTEVIACEVKKTRKEISAMMEFMTQFAHMDPLSTEPHKLKEKNAYRKVIGLRKSRPRFFWALGPEGQGAVYRLEWDAEGSVFDLVPVPDSALTCDS